MAIGCVYATSLLAPQVFYHGRIQSWPMACIKSWQQSVQRMQWPLHCNPSQAPTSNCNEHSCNLTSQDHFGGNADASWSH